MSRIIIILLSVVAVNACTLFPPQERGSMPVELPEDYSLYIEGAIPPDKWWESFGSLELNRMVETALSNNFDLRSAWQRMKQAEAALGKSHSNLWPTVNYDAGAEKQWIQTRTSKDGGRINTDTENWAAGLSAAYEVDLWGRLKAQRKAEGFAFQASREDLHTAKVTVTATIVETWLDILATRRQIAITEDQIRTNTTLLELQEFRFLNGKATALDVSQQRQALASARSELPLLELSERQLMNSLAFLLGQSSRTGIDINGYELPEIIPLPEAGLPADLIAARPDVRAAGLRLKSADWTVSASRADRLPDITLSARSAFSSGKLDLLFDNWVNTLAAGITGPLFDGGRRSYEVERTRAVAEERLTDYARTVANAIKEVENSLASETYQQTYIQRLSEQKDAAQMTLKNARTQYINGQSDYLSYLAAWTSIQNLERKLVAENAGLIKNRVTLYRTLGGNWIESPEDPVSPQVKKQNETPGA